MHKLKFTVIPVCLGIFLIIFSWYQSYPVLTDSPYEFVFNRFSYLYWIGLAILFSSFFVISMKTENNILRWAMTVCTVFLMFSPAYFYFTLPTSDSNQMRGLTEYFVSTGDLSRLDLYHTYYQWPVFFIITKMIISITGLEQRLCEFIIYGGIGFAITSFLYLIIHKVKRNTYIAAITFFIILFYFFNFQFWSPFALAFCLILFLFYLDSLRKRPEIIIAVLIIFSVITFTHALVPLFFVVYSFIMSLLEKNKRHLSLFIITSVIYLYFQILNQHLEYYINQLMDFSFFDYFVGKIAVTTIHSSAQQPFIDVIAQLLSRFVVITTMLIAVFGFIILLKRREFRRIDYAMLLTGSIFITTLVVAPSNYSMMSNRSYFLLCIPAAMGASYLCESKLSKYFKTFFLVILILFTFVLIHQSFYSQEVFFQTPAEYQSANFLINTVDWRAQASILSSYRLKLYMIGKSPNGNVIFDHVSSRTLLGNYDFVIYNIGLAKGFGATNYTVEEIPEEFDIYHFNLIYNSGNFSYIFARNLN